MLIIKPNVLCFSVIYLLPIRFLNISLLPLTLQSHIHCKSLATMWCYPAKKKVSSPPIVTHGGRIRHKHKQSTVKLIWFLLAAGILASTLLPTSVYHHCWWFAARPLSSVIDVALCFPTLYFLKHFLSGRFWLVEVTNDCGIQYISGFLVMLDV